MAKIIHNYAPFQSLYNLCECFRLIGFLLLNIFFFLPFLYFSSTWSYRSFLQIVFIQCISVYDAKVRVIPKKYLLSFRLIIFVRWIHVHVHIDGILKQRLISNKRPTGHIAYLLNHRSPVKLAQGFWRIIFFKFRPSIFAILSLSFHRKGSGPSFE